MDRTQYGAYLRTQRISQGKNKEEVARSMGIEVFMLEAWEDGRLLPNVAQLHALAEALQLPYEQLSPPDAPQNTPPLQKRRFRPGIITAVFLSIAFTVLYLRSTAAYLPSNSEPVVATQSARRGPILAREKEVEVAKRYILESACFRDLALEEEDLVLIDAPRDYARRNGRLVTVTSYVFSAISYQFYVTGYQEGEIWQIENAFVTLPLK